MQKPSDWAALFRHTPTPDAIAILAAGVREYLTTVPLELLPCSTSDLMEGLWPVRFVGPEFHHSRRRMIEALMLMAKTSLRDCARKAEKPRVRFGKPIYPWLWYSPAHQSTVQTCPQCGHKFIGG